MLMPASQIWKDVSIEITFYSKFIDLLQILMKMDRIIFWCDGLIQILVLTQFYDKGHLLWGWVTQFLEIWSF